MIQLHFLPSIGEKVMLGGKMQVAYIKNIYHGFVQTDDFEPDVFLQAVTVVLTSAAPLASPKSEHH